MEWSAEIVCAHCAQSVHSLQRIGNDFPSLPPDWPYAKLCLGNRWPHIYLAPDQLRAFDHSLYLFECDVSG